MTMVAIDLIYHRPEMYMYIHTSRQSLERKVSSVSKFLPVALNCNSTSQHSIEYVHVWQWYSLYYCLYYVCTQNGVSTIINNKHNDAVGHYM